MAKNYGLFSNEFFKSVVLAPNLELVAVRLARVCVEERVDAERHIQRRRAQTARVRLDKAQNGESRLEQNHVFRPDRFERREQRLALTVMEEQRNKARACDFWIKGL